MTQTYPAIPGVVTMDAVREAAAALGLPIERCTAITIGLRWVEVTYQALDEDGKLILHYDNLITNTFTIPIISTPAKEN
jgi:hypothetical protein